MYQGGSSIKKGHMLAMREQDVELPRDADVWACEWPSDDFMVEAGFKKEFDAYVRNAELEDFLQDNVLSTINWLIPLCGGSNITVRVILLVSYLIFMIHLIPWT